MQQKLTGEISNGDLARTNFSGDYDATIEGIEKVGDKDTYKLKLMARRKTVTYSRVDYWIGVKDAIPVKATFYALSGKVLKTALYSGVKDVLDVPRVTKLLFTDALNKNNQSILIYSDHMIGRLPDNLFNRDSLRE